MPFAVKPVPSGPTLFSPYPVVGGSHLWCSLPVPAHEDSLGEEHSSGHLGKLRKDYVEYPAPGMFNLVGNPGPEACGLGLLGRESYALFAVLPGSSLPPWLPLKAAPAARLGFSLWICSLDRLCTSVLTLVPWGSAHRTPPGGPRPQWLCSSWSGFGGCLQTTSTQKLQN